MIYEKMLAESRRLDQEIKSIQLQLEQFPDGKLVCTSNGKHVSWFISDGHTSAYLPKKERALAEKLAYKKFLSLQLEHLIQEKRAVQFYLRHHDCDAIQKEQSFLYSTKYKDLLTPVFTPLSDEFRQWANEPFERNEKYPETLTHRSPSGNKVRSKSEVLIDMMLFKNKIPFRYECLLQLGDSYLFPDFTIRHPATGEFYYWEHFGLMDNETYRKNVCSKLQLYISNGITPSIQLITTYETREHPLSIEVIEKTIERYFL